MLPGGACGTVATMLTPTDFHWSARAEVLAPGTVLRRRHEVLTTVLHLESGRALRGVLEGDALRHQLGVVEGPFWVDAASALLDQPFPLDLVAETTVQVRRMPIAQFRQQVADLPPEARELLIDMASGYREQSVLAVSRLVQDAEARCAQWLLQHASADHSGAMQVTLHQRKRLIAAQLGIAPETFSRVLRHLRERGLVHGTGTVLRLPEPRALESMAGG